MMLDLRSLANRLLHIVSRGRLQFVDDAAAVQKVQVRVIGDVLQDNVPRMSEYGFQSSPPIDSDAVLLYLAGNPSDGVVIATGNQQYRLRNLQPGEVAISDNRGQKVYLSASGIRIEGTSLTINASGGATLNGNLTVNGNTSFAGQVSANGHRIDDTHQHTGGTFSGLTGAPI